MGVVVGVLVRSERMKMHGIESEDAAEYIEESSKSETGIYIAYSITIIFATVCPEAPATIS